MPDDDNPLDPAHLSLANRAKWLAGALVIAPLLFVWVGLTKARDWLTSVTRID